MREPSRSLGRLAIALLTLAAFAACAPAPPAAPTASADSPATVSDRPEVVLDAYLKALVAGDCETGRMLVTARFRIGTGELCGVTHVSAYRINAEPARPPEELIFATILTTTGTADGSIQAGALTWFYSLVQQPDGSWRITGGGSGP